MHDRRAIQGFSLFEIAVVLAIVGLLAGAVIAAISYIRTSQTTTLANEAKSYLNAMQQFETNYGGAIAGDMGNATSYWGDDATRCSDVAITNGSPGTCNGNGNGAILVPEMNVAELFYAFQHLALAGLITGNYSGAAGSGGANDAEIGTNIPALSVDNVSAILSTAYNATTGVGYALSDTYLQNGFYGNYYFLTGRTVTDSFPTAGYLTPAEAFELDNKFDNGIPNSGWVRSYNSTQHPNCVSGSAYNTSTASPANACGLIFTKP